MIGDYSRVGTGMVVTVTWDGEQVEVSQLEYLLTWLKYHISQEVFF